MSARDTDRPLADRTASDALVFDRNGDIRRLREIMARLRAPDGCPWDRVQDFASIAPYTIEEACEVADAIARDDMDGLCDELGDLLLQVAYHARIAEEAGRFSFDDVVRAVSDKMLRRHPHVFGTAPGGPRADPDTVSWEAIKAAERADRGETRDSVLDGVPVTLSGLTRATALTRQAATVGFDWTDSGDVLAKIAEEAGELTREIGGDPERIEDEYGDLLFTLVNLGRHLRVDPEGALRRTNAKFESRFRGVEARLAAEGRTAAEATLPEMEAHWVAEKLSRRA
jgi:ATP diphosphatase